MFIKLTRLDNSPIWINAAFVVTVEPRKGGGSIVVPIGDGLDYDVRETTDQVLAMLGEAPVPAVVPVPAPRMLAPTPEDVSPDTEPLKDEPPSETTAEEPKPAKRTRRTKKVAEGEAEAKPVRKTRAKAKKPAVDFPDEQIERLKKMVPGSMRKLINTLVTQFKVTDAEAVVAFLQERGIVEVEREHVIWK